MTDQQAPDDERSSAQDAPALDPAVEAIESELRETRQATIGALLVATALLRIGAVGTGVAIQFRLIDIAGGRPNGVAIGLIGAAQAVTEMIFAPILARYADRFGRRRFLVGGPIVSVVAVLLIGQGMHPGQLGGARLLEGLGAAAFVPTALGTVAAATAHDRTGRARASGAFEGATLLGYAGGVGLGSFAYFGLHRQAFVLLASLYAMAALICAVLVPKVPPLPVHSLRVVFRTALGPGPLRAFLPGWMACFAFIGAFVANLPALLRQRAVPGQTLMHHLDTRVIGLLLIAWILLLLAGIILWTPWVPRLGPAIVMRRAVPGAFVVVGSLALMNHVPPAATGAVVPALVIGILWLAGFGPAAVMYLADSSEALAADRSALMSFYTVALAGGGAIGAVLGGVAAHLHDIDGLIVTGAILASITYLSLGPVVRYARASGRLPA